MARRETRGSTRRGGSSNAPRPREIEEEEVPEWPNGIFVNAGAEHRYKEHKLTKKVMAEGWFEGTALARVNRLTNKAYKNLLKEPTKGYEEIAREFMANWPYPENDLRYLRGEWFNFSSSAINKYYDLPDYAEGETDLEKQRHKRNFLYKAVKELKVEGDPTTWEINNDLVPMNFPAKSLKADAKLLLRFVKSRIRPMVHNSDMYPKEAALVYAMMQGWTINIGAEIVDAIEEAATFIGPRGLPFPSLIAGICRMTHEHIFHGLEHIEDGKVYGSVDYGRFKAKEREQLEKVRRAAGPDGEEEEDDQEPAPRRPRLPDRALGGDPDWQTQMRAHMQETRRLARAMRFRTRLTAAEMQGLPYDSVREQSPDTP